MFFDRDRPPPRGNRLRLPRDSSRRAKQIVPCGIIKGAGQASVARLGSDGLMRFPTALNKAFENHGCMAAILLEPDKESPL